MKLLVVLLGGLFTRMTISKSVQLPGGCCSYDTSSCGDDVWCSAEPDRCEFECGGIWIEANEKRELQDGYCCSDDFRSCDMNSRCDISEDACSSCEGFWIDPSENQPGCTARYADCSSSDECCGDSMACLVLPDFDGVGMMRVCETRFCCSDDFEFCMDDDSCSLSESNCQQCSGGFWVDRVKMAAGCAGEYESCASDSDCCSSGLSCQNGFCNAALFFETESPTTNPTDAPTENPTQAPTTASPSMAPTTSAPTPAPSESQSPSASPTESHSPSETPSTSPSLNPSSSQEPTSVPSLSQSPTTSPTESPSASSEPSSSLSNVPSESPSSTPSTDSPSSSPSDSPSVSPSLVPSEAPTTAFCCSEDMLTCGMQEFCQASRESCGTCLGHWIVPPEENSCTARSDVCTSDDECCGDSSVCLPSDDGSDESRCQASQCCSTNLLDCLDDNFCNFSEESCGTCANSFWIEKREHTDCLTLNSECESDDECCGSISTCQVQEDAFGTYKACTIIDALLGGQPPFSQQNAAVEGTEFPPFPGPPYISVSRRNSELITLPDPPQPELFAPSSDCPHDAAGLKNWNDPSTWGGSIPVARQDVTLPVNSKVLVSETLADQYGVIHVPASSELIIGEAQDGSISIDAVGFDVLGRFTIGSETCKIETAITITLHSTRPAGASSANPANNLTRKGLVVSGGGVLNIHGKRFFRTWTRLAKTVEPGESVLMLQHEVNWEPGQEIVLVTTAMKDSREYHENEVLVVDSVHTNPPNGVGAVVYLTSEVQYRHVASAGYQAEVGLLTRNIKIQGAADDSEPTDPDPLNCHDTVQRNGRDTRAPCPGKELTGYGGHIIVIGTARGFVEGVELYRMGQTNVLGRYPFHFHMTRDCEGCYFRHSSVHRSFYRGVTIHGTNKATVTENVAFDVVGFCFYMEDGVEEENEISFNLAAHIHMINPGLPFGQGRPHTEYRSSSQLTFPGDVAAAGFYISNMHNYVIGNAASGGWTGFAFPVLAEAHGPSKGLYPNFVPSARPSLVIDGNTAHSTGWWWGDAGGFYFGGALYTRGGQTEYNPGQGFEPSHDRRPCNVNPCDYGDCVWNCPRHEEAWNRITNSKAFLIPGSALSSWNGRIEIDGFETHDVELAAMSLSPGFWMNNLLAVCRTGEDIALPPGSSATDLKGDGFFWYDTEMEHIITRATFRNCGYRSSQYDDYDTSPTRGCGNDSGSGCSAGSTVFGFLAHSDQFNPELMQATSEITFENCGRRFSLHDSRKGKPGFDNSLQSVSGRLQNWFDKDGSTSGLPGSSFIVSGYSSARAWWEVDDHVAYDRQGPLRFINADPTLSATTSPERGLGHLRINWDNDLHRRVGDSICGNEQVPALPCPTVGRMRHLGPSFSSGGLPMTAVRDVVGMVGGYGWVLELNAGSPTRLEIDHIEVDPDTPLLLHIPYPTGTSFAISAHGDEDCRESGTVYCSHRFQQVNSIDDVRHGNGDKYYVDPDTGTLTVRIIMYPRSFQGSWKLWDYDDPGVDGVGYALGKFERDGIILPRKSSEVHLSIEADCRSRDGTYCNRESGSIDTDVCPSLYQQVSYDACCSVADPSQCVYANGQTNI